MTLEPGAIARVRADSVVVDPHGSELGLKLLDYAKVVVTNSQLLGLPNAEIILVPAPGTSKKLQLIYALMVGHFVAPYNNIDGNSTFGIDDVDNNQSLCTAPTGFFGVGNPFTDFTYSCPLDAQQTLLQSSTNNPLRLFATQDDTGQDYGGGDTANTLTVHLFYTTLDLS